MVEVPVGWVGQLQGPNRTNVKEGKGRKIINFKPEADVIESLVVNAVGFISIFNQLVN